MRASRRTLKVAVGLVALTLRLKPGQVVEQRADVELPRVGASDQLRESDAQATALTRLYALAEHRSDVGDLLRIGIDRDALHVHRTNLLLTRELRSWVERCDRASSTGRTSTTRSGEASRRNQRVLGGRRWSVRSSADRLSAASRGCSVMLRSSVSGGR